jgi:peptidoglycan/xylan/chitin deacetylase (PgdA/CDA1 family)
MKHRSDAPTVLEHRAVQREKRNPVAGDALDTSAPKARIRPLLAFALLAKSIGVTLWIAGYARAAAVFFFIPDPFVLHAIFAPSAQGLVRVFTTFTAEEPSVWLTIDDGPDERDTPQILDLLDRHGARATFFVVGERAARHPHLIGEIVRRGHQVAHHTHTHPVRTFWIAGPRRIAAELDRALDVLRPLGFRPQLFRAPVGFKPLTLAPALAARGLHCVGWSVRSGDTRITSPEQLVARMTRLLRPGAIVLLHEGADVPHSIRIRGIALLLEAITARGLRCKIPAIHELR